MFQFTMFVANLKIQWKSFLNVFNCKMKKKKFVVPNPPNASTIAQTTTTHHLNLHIGKKSKPPKYHQPPNRHQPSKKLPPTIQKKQPPKHHQPPNHHQPPKKKKTNNNQIFRLESHKTSMNLYRKPKKKKKKSKFENLTTQGRQDRRSHQNPRPLFINRTLRDDAREKRRGVCTMQGMYMKFSDL